MIVEITLIVPLIIPSTITAVLPIFTPIIIIAMLPIILFASVFIVIFEFDKACGSVGELKKEARK